MNLNTARKRLLSRKNELEQRLHRIELDLDKPRNSDFTEMVSERENDDVLEEIGHTGLEELRQINAALHRIDSGSYGVCDVCGQYIAEKRLEILPFATRCTQCSE